MIEKVLTVEVRNSDGTGRHTKHRFLFPGDHVGESAKQLAEDAVGGMSVSEKGYLNAALEKGYNDFAKQINEAQKEKENETVDIKNRIALRMDYLDELRRLYETCPSSSIEKRIEMTCNFIELDLAKG